ncbi:MAG: NAD(P)-binding domain-containing protein [Segetibacter sp.]
MNFGIIGSGSWATALAKILTDNNNSIYWWIRNSGTIRHLQQRRHNPHYLSSAYFNTSLLRPNENIEDVIEDSDVLVIAVPSAFIENAFEPLAC